MIRLALVMVRTMPGIDTDYARQITRAEVIDQYRLFVCNDEKASREAKVSERFRDRGQLVHSCRTLNLVQSGRNCTDAYPIARAALKLRDLPTFCVARKPKVASH